jgi:YaiO family outer membrane protein
MRLSLFCFLYLLLCTRGIAQDYPIPKQDNDQLFQDARKTAFEGNWGVAKYMCQQVISDDPNYFDAVLLLGRILAWETKHDSARLILVDNLLAVQPDNLEVYLALIDNELWRENFDEAIRFADLGLARFPNSEDLLVRKAKALFLSGNTTSGFQILEEILAINPSNEEANALLKMYPKPGVVDYILLDYYFDFFKEPYIRRWHMQSVGVAKRIPLGLVIAKVNLGQLVQVNQALFTNPAIQYELEAWPVITGHSYGLINYAYSAAPVFPKHRATLEYFSRIAPKWEASGGVRGFYGTENVLFITGSLSLYASSYWFSIRPFTSPRENGWTFAINAMARKYMGPGENYIYGLAGYGTSPDDPGSSIIVLKRLTSYRFRLGILKPLNRRWFIHGYTGWELEGYQVERKRHVYSVMGGIRYYL